MYSHYIKTYYIETCRIIPHVHTFNVLHMFTIFFLFMILLTGCESQDQSSSTLMTRDDVIDQMLHDMWIDLLSNPLDSTMRQEYSAQDHRQEHDHTLIDMYETSLDFNSGDFNTGDLHTTNNHAFSDMDMTRPIDLFEICTEQLLVPSIDSFTMAESQQYSPPRVDTQSIFAMMLHALLAESYIEAKNLSESIHYSICRGHNSESNLLRIAPNHTQGNAVVIIRITDSRPIVFATPHPLYERDTLQEGLVLFTHLSARAFIFSQTHRCANEISVECDGMTSVCGVRQAYKQSDMAHTSHSIFQTAHEVLYQAYPNDLFVNLHGMMREGVSLSNGTRNPITIHDPVARLASQFAMHFPDQKITTCNSYEGARIESHLCGTTNVQGRHINHSIDACMEASSMASEKFIHLEQSSLIRSRPLDVARAFLHVLEAD